jgi:hypothetical protein
VARLHTELPTTFAGERQFAQSLAGLNDPHLHVWFALNYLPGVLDIDCLIWHEWVGVFVVEVKGVPLTAVEAFDLQWCKIQGRERCKSPARQAYDAGTSLRDYLKDKMARLPFMVGTACWPLVRRSEWHGYFETPDLGCGYSESLLFVEDLASTEKLRARLEHIYKRPPVRSGAKFRFRHDAEDLGQLAAALAPSTRARGVAGGLSGLGRVEHMHRLHAATPAEPVPGWSLDRAKRLVWNLAAAYSRWQAGAPDAGQWANHAQELAVLLEILQEALPLGAEDPGAWAAVREMEARLADRLTEGRVFRPLSRSLGDEVKQHAEQIVRRSREVERELRAFVDAVRAMSPEERGRSETARTVEQFQQVRDQLIRDLSLRGDYQRLHGKFQEAWAHFLRLRTALAVRERHRPTLKHLDRLNLNEDQEQFVTLDRPGHFRIQGASGSGKTVVLLHRAVRLARSSPSGEVRVFTINRSLAELLRANIQAVHGVVPDNLHIEAFYDFLLRCVGLFGRQGHYRLVDDRSGERIGISWRDFYRHRTNVFSEPESKKLVAFIERRSAARVDAGQYLREEMVYIRSMLRKEEREQYADSERGLRRGRCIELNTAQRVACLKILSAWEEWLDVGDLCDIDGLTAHAADHFWKEADLARIRSACPTDHVLVDEVQDFSTLELSIIRRLVADPEAPNAFFFVGDLNQKVYPKHHVGTQAGFNFQGRAALLKKNYRNTRQILQAAYRVVAAHPPQPDEAVEVVPPELSPFEGGRPVVFQTDPGSQAAHVLAVIAQRPAARLAVVSENESLLGEVRRAAGAKGYRCFELFRNEDLDRWRAQEGDALSAAVVVSRLEAVKGFEFDTVVACDLSEGVTPRPGTAAEEIWREAAIVYSALTRARDELIITYCGRPSPFLTLMREDVEWDAPAELLSRLAALAR